MSISTNCQRILFAAACLAPAVYAQEQWDIGASAGYGFHTNVTATNAAGSATTGFKPGVAFSIFASNETMSWLGGEVRYTYRQNDAFVSGGGSEARFDADSHVVHYDVILQPVKRPAKVRPFLAAGGGMKFYRGTGREAAFQPLSNFVALTKTTQVVPVVSVGGGVKVEVSRRVTLRVEVRDYVSPLADDVIAAVPGARVRGWVHDIVPLFGLSFNLGR